VKAFRPVLKALKIREPGQYQRPVYIAEFDHLHLLDLDSCSIEILPADLDECSGVFASAYTKTGLLRNYIILDKSLFDKSNKDIREQLKITGIHEFCHFIAIIYAATVGMTIEKLKADILERLHARIDKLPKETLIKIYDILSSSKDEKDSLLEELTDRHFRLGIEGNTPDYNILFYHLMFSKDLFEIDFTKEKQSEFKDLINNKKDIEGAVTLLLESLTRASQEKDVPFKMAYKQLKSWIHNYTE
jgi:hypothetical protein